MIANLFTCDKCHSVSQDNDYRTNQDNFYQLTISLYKLGSGGGPMMPGGPQGVSNRNETFQICSECKATVDAEIDAIVGQLKAS